MKKHTFILLPSFVLVSALQALAHSTPVAISPAIVPAARPAFFEGQAQNGKRFRWLAQTSIASNPDDPNLLRIASQWKSALAQDDLLAALKVLEKESVHLRKAADWSWPLLETAAPELQMKCFRQPPYTTDTVCYKTAAKFVELALAAMMRFPEAQLAFLQPILAVSASTGHTPLFADSAHSALHNIREHIDNGGKLVNPNGTALRAADEPQSIALTGLVQAAAALRSKFQASGQSQAVVILTLSYLVESYGNAFPKNPFSHEQILQAVGLTPQLVAKTKAEAQAAAMANEESRNRTDRQVKSALLQGHTMQGLQALEAGRDAFGTEGQLNVWRVQLDRVGEAVGTLCQKQVFQYTADGAVQSTECHEAAIKLVQLTQATMLRYFDNAQMFYQGLLVFAGWSGDGATYERVGRAALEQMSLRLKTEEAPASTVANAAATVDEAHRTAAMVLAVNIGQQVGSGDQSQRARVMRLTALAMYANAIFPLPNWTLQSWQKTVPDLILFLEDQLANPKHGDVERLILCNAYIRSSQWRPDQGLQASKAIPHLKLLHNSANLTVRDTAKAMLAKL